MNRGSTYDIETRDTSSPASMRPRFMNRGSTYNSAALPSLVAVLQ